MRNKALVLLALLSAIGTRAAGPAVAAPATDAVLRAAPGIGDLDARGIVDLLYINRPDSALTVLRSHQRTNPEDPYVLLLVAKVLRERLNDEDHNKELIRRATEPIHAVLDSAIALSNEALDRNGDDYRQYYYRGYGWLSKAQLYVLTRSYWSAGRSASHGKDDLERYLEKHPDDADAQGALGAYYYFADAIPGFIKIVAKLLLMPGGDREKGLEMMEYAATHDGVFETDWGMVRAAVDLVFEGHFEKGADELVRLLDEYPLYTRLAEPIAVVAPLYPTRIKEFRDAATNAVQAQRAADQRFVDWNLVKRLQLVQAFTDSYFGAPQAAIEQYTALIRDPPRHPDWVLPLALLNCGYLYQKTGDTEGARKAFDAGLVSTRSTYYHQAAEVMREMVDKPIITVELSDLEFIERIYDGRIGEASEMLGRFKSVRGEDALTDFYTGEIQLLKGDFSGARQAYEKALTRGAIGGEQVYQTLSAARLAELAGQEGRYSEARDLLKSAQRYCYANYLLDFLIESRQRFYHLLEHGDIEAKPSLLVQPARS